MELHTETEPIDGSMQILKAATNALRVSEKEIERLRAALTTIAEWPTPAKTPVSVELRNVQLVAWSALQGGAIMNQQPTTDLDELRQIGTLLDGGYLISDKRGIVTQAAAEIERLREVLQLATHALSDGLWDYGPGQDGHDKCDEVIEICRAALAQEHGEHHDNQD